MSGGTGKHAEGFWAAEAVLAAAGGRCVVRAVGGARLSGVTTDSRAVAAGEVFVALRGEKFDGHEFLTDAARAGASVLIVDRQPPPELAGERGGPTVLMVDDTLAALHRLAKAYRRALGADGTKVVAITGSSGKTSTRVLMHAALSARLRGTQSPKSFNNHVGVPLTILAARPGDDFLAAEAGTNHAGEMAPLAELLEPDAAVVTNVGSAHLGHFGTRDAIAREKAKLLRRIRPGGVAILPADCDLLSLLLSAVPEHVGVMQFGRGGEAEVRLTQGPTVRSEGTRFVVDGRTEISLSLLGEHNAINALAAVAVGRWMGLSDGEVAGGLAGAVLPEMRLQALRLGTGDDGVVVLNDAYNANPESMWAAVKALAGYPVAVGGRRIAVLGDMLELGEHSERLHRELLTRVAGEGSVDEVIAVGPAMSQAGEGVGGVRVCGDWREGLARELAARFRSRDVVLLKGSRGMKMERLVEVMQEAQEREGKRQADGLAG